MTMPSTDTDRYGYWRWKSVDWPMHVAADIAHLRRIPSWCDDEWIRSAIYYLRDQATGTPQPRYGDVFQAIDQAVAIRDAGGLDSAILEARILARESASEIAKNHSLDPSVVQAYEGLLFRIDQARDPTEWIVLRAIGLPGAGSRAQGIGQILRRHGYFAGPVVLERLIQTVRKLRGESLIADLDFSNNGSHLDAAELAIRKAIAVELLPFGRAATMLAIQLAVDEKSRSARLSVKPAKRADLAQPDWRASAIEFAHLRPETTAGNGSANQVSVA